MVFADTKFSLNSCLPGLFTMFGLMLIYFNHGMYQEWAKLVFPTYYSFPVLDALFAGFLLGFVNFAAISIFIDQAVRNKDTFRGLSDKFARVFFLEEKPKECDICARFAATICAIFYFATCTIAILVTPGAMSANFIIVIWGLGSVMSISTWIKVRFHYYQLNRVKSIDKLKMDHTTLLELVRQFVLVGVAAATGFVIYGVVNSLGTIPQSVSFSSSFQIAVFSLAAVTIYLIVGLVLGVISPLLIFLEKIGDRMEKIAEV
jgi:hypothetical protein